MVHFRLIYLNEVAKLTNTTLFCHLAIKGSVFLGKRQQIIFTSLVLGMCRWTYDSSDRRAEAESISVSARIYSQIYLKDIH